MFKHTEQGMEEAAVAAERAIHDNDIDHLTQLLADYPALANWHTATGDSLLKGTGAFRDSFDADQERNETRPACAALLIDAGAVADPFLVENVIGSRSRGMLQLLQSKNALPRTLRNLAATGDIDEVRSALRSIEGTADELTVVNQAFICACRFKQAAVASMLLDRCIALDGELGRHIDGWRGRASFIEYLGEHPREFSKPNVDKEPTTPWRAFLMHEAMRLVNEGDLAAFKQLLRTEPSLLGESCIGFQLDLFENFAFTNRESFLVELLALEPELLKCKAPSHSPAIVYALEYGNAHLVSFLTRIWPLPDDLPHAAGMGDFDAVKRWFDAESRPALGNLDDHYPVNNERKRSHLHWGAGNAQQVLDVALAWSCINRQFEIASFLLERGANINTNWSTHEPAGILHECAVQGNFAAARFLIDHGVDLALVDYRWNGTAEGWAYHAARNMEMTELLEAARLARSGPQQDGT